MSPLTDWWRERVLGRGVYVRVCVCGGGRYVYVCVYKSVCVCVFLFKSGLMQVSVQTWGIIVYTSV